jgi:hypothetical protein
MDYLGTVPDVLDKDAQIELLTRQVAILKQRNEALQQALYEARMLPSAWPAAAGQEFGAPQARSVGLPPPAKQNAFETPRSDSLMDIEASYRDFMNLLSGGNNSQSPHDVDLVPRKGTTQTFRTFYVVALRLSGMIEPSARAGM